MSSDLPPKAPRRLRSEHDCAGEVIREVLARSTDGTVTAPDFTQLLDERKKRQSMRERVWVGSAAAGLIAVLGASASSLLPHASIGTLELAGEEAILDDEGPLLSDSTKASSSTQPAPHDQRASDAHRNTSSSEDSRRHSAKGHIGASEADPGRAPSEQLSPKVGHTSARAHQAPNGQRGGATLVGTQSATSTASAPELSHELCAQHVRQQKYDLAMHCYEGQIRRGGVSAELAYLERARLQAHTLGQHKLALSELDAYLAKFPLGALKPEATLMRIRLLAQGGNFDEAELEITRISSLMPEKTLSLREQVVDLAVASKKCEQARRISQAIAVELRTPEWNKRHLGACQATPGGTALLP